jgi:hypothetical protein
MNRYTDANGNVYRIYKKPTITVITPKAYSAHFFPQGETAQNLFTSYGCSAVLNGTYFGYNNDKSFFPAGVWYQFGAYLRPPYQPAFDRNLRVLLS